MKFEHEMAHLEQMSEEIGLYLEEYVLFEQKYKTLSPDQIAMIADFVGFVKKRCSEAIDEPRGTIGRTYREAAKYP